MKHVMLRALLAAALAALSSPESTIELRRRKLAVYPPQLISSLPPPPHSDPLRPPGAITVKSSSETRPGLPANLLRAIASQLCERGVAVVDGVFGTVHATNTLLEASLLWQAEKSGVSIGGWPLISSPGVGASGRDLARKLRGDYVTWEWQWRSRPELKKEALTTTTLLGHRKKVSELRDALSPHLAAAGGAGGGGAAAAGLRSCAGKNLTFPKLGGQSDSMLSMFPPDGAAYLPHVDVSRAAASKHDDDDDEAGYRAVLSLVYYINAPDWDPQKDGGCLRVKQLGDTGETMDVAPTHDRLVIMLSEHTEHEVLPTYRRRHALSNWLQEKEGAPPGKDRSIGHSEVSLSCEAS